MLIGVLVHQYQYEPTRLTMDGPTKLVYYRIYTYVHIIILLRFENERLEI